MAIKKLDKKEQEVLFEAMRQLNRGETITVICPKCGNAITGDIVGTSASVQCKTKDCIQLTCRGI